MSEAKYTEPAVVHFAGDHAPYEYDVTAAG